MTLGPLLPTAKFIAVLREGVVGGDAVSEIAGAPTVEECIQLAIPAYQAYVSNITDLIATPFCVVIIDIDTGAGVCWFGTRTDSAFYWDRAQVSP